MVLASVNYVKQEKKIYTLDQIQLNNESKEATQSLKNKSKKLHKRNRVPLF
jgi:hypothetical protein